MIEPRIASATRFSRVCETIVPSTTGSRSRTRPSRLATMSARDGSPRRAGSVADISTPIITPRVASRRRTRTPGSAARRMACHDSARSSMDAHISANDRKTQTGVAASSAFVIESSPIRRSASAASPAPSAAPPQTAARRATRTARLRRELGSSTSGDGWRTGGCTGPPSASASPARLAIALRWPAGTTDARSAASSYASITSPATVSHPKRSARSRAAAAICPRRSASVARSCSDSPSATGSPGFTSSPSMRPRTTSR